MKLLYNAHKKKTPLIRSWARWIQSIHSL